MMQPKWISPPFEWLAPAGDASEGIQQLRSQMRDEFEDTMRNSAKSGEESGVNDELDDPKRNVGFLSESFSFIGVIIYGLAIAGIYVGLYLCYTASV